MEFPHVMVIYHYQHYSCVPFVSNIYNDRYNFDIVTILGNYFKWDLKAAEIDRRIPKLERNELISDRTVQKWFNRFKGSDYDALNHQEGKQTATNGKYTEKLE